MSKNLEKLNEVKYRRGLSKSIKSTTLIRIWERTERLKYSLIEFSKLKKRIVSKPLQVLDVGAGSCFTSVMLKILLPHAEIFSMDISSDIFTAISYEVISTYLESLEGFHFIQADWDHLPFKTNSFDLVTSGAALHHSGNIMRTLREIHRVLKVEGFLCLLNEPTFNLPYPSFGKFEKRFGVIEKGYTLFQWISFLKTFFEVEFFPTELALRVLRGDVNEYYLQKYTFGGKIIRILKSLRLKLPRWFVFFLPGAYTYVCQKKDV